MINIRYHVYSLVAVFLALAIGVAAGSTVVQRSVVDNLRSTQDHIERNLDALQSSNNDLQNQLDGLQKRSDALADAGPTTLLANVMNGESIILVRSAGVDGDTVSRARNVLKVAGADVVADVQLKAAAADTDTLASLASTLQLADDQRAPDTVQQDVGQRLGTLLAGARNSTEAAALGQVTTVPSGGGRATGASTAAPAADLRPTAGAKALRDYLDQLSSAGLVSVQGSLGKDGTVSSLGAKVLVLGGATTDFDPAPILKPMLESLSAAGDTVALTADAPLSSRPPKGHKVHDLVPDVRGDGHLQDVVSTVDDIGDFAGLAAMVLGLSDLAAGRVGDYGTGDGAEALLPDRQP